MVMEIVHYGDPVLRETGKRVETFDGRLSELFENMVATMTEAEGIGLAAQQVGLALQFCVVDLRGFEPDFDYTYEGGKPPLEVFMPMALANPKITFPESERKASEEGCLSFPEIRGEIERPDWIRCEFQDLQGNRQTIECNGLLARCIQHEIDHLNGVLFIDRMKKKILRSLQPALAELEGKTARAAK